MDVVRSACLDLNCHVEKRLQDVDMSTGMLGEVQVGHPELDAWKYPLPGDDAIFTIERLVIHLEPEPRIVLLNMPPDPHRSTTSDHIAGRGGVFLDVEWSADSAQLAFVSSSRDHKQAQLRVADPQTGAVRDVFSEQSDTYFESGFSDANWRVLHQRDEFLWFSERDNWGHLYLYDLQSGDLKQQLTTGNWAVLDVQKVDLEILDKSVSPHYWTTTLK